MPVVALATTEVPEAVPAEAGIISTNVSVLITSLSDLLRQPQRARELGQSARAYAKARYGLERFTADWDRLLGELV